MTLSQDAHRSTPVFRPSAEAVARSQLTAFIGRCEDRGLLESPAPASLQEFSTGRYRDFWREFLDWSGILHEGPPDPVCTDDRCEFAAFFPEVRLNYAENLLRSASRGERNRPAVTARHASGATERLSRGELASRVAALAAELRRIGVSPGDRVVAVARNSWEAVVGALATASVGAAFASASPDMGVPGILSRFEQLSPKILMATLRPTGEVLLKQPAEQAAEIARSLPSLEALVILDDGAPADGAGLPTVRVPDLMEGAAPDPAGDCLRFPFNHPLFIMFSSGTTGRPKCIVHGAGGTLLEHVKEHRLHGDLRPGDKLFFHTSTAWMMWNWQLSALACGAEIVLFDGPVTGPETLWEIAADENATVFGTSPPYLKLCEDAGYSPRRAVPLPALRAVLSTGSVLHERQYDWVREQVGDVPLQSISGGTDIIGCFVLGNPNLPVHRGESQCRSLGLDVAAMDAAAGSEVGELVCRNPFPSRPLGFYGDADGSRFHKAYFAQHPGVWTHGDLIEFTAAGGARIHGRSDSILNIDGIRIGPAEIYRVLQTIPEIREAMAVEQRMPDGSRMVLVVVPQRPGALDTRLKTEIRRQLALQTTAAHVPALIVEAAELPTTHSGKRSERAMRDALDGAAAVNADVLRNPDCLERIRRQVRLADEGARDEAGAPAPGLADKLRRVWEDTLGLRGVDPDRSFFELGGTSLAAIRMCRSISDLLGVPIGPWILIHAPTLRGLTIALGTSGTGVSPIVALRRPSAAGRPLFLIPGMHGDVIELHALVRRMSHDRPLYGIRARGLAPGESMRTRVEAMAEDYLAHLRSFQPSGPYALIGYSFGGLVAFELAARLRRAGAAVDFLGLIDTDVHDGCLPPGERAAFWVARALGYVRMAAADPWTQLPELWRRYRRTRGLALAGRGGEEVASPLLQQIARASRRAFSRYRPPRYDGDVTIFRATRRWPRFCDPLPVWRRQVAGSVRVRWIEGLHTDIVQEPCVVDLAREVDDAIAEARGFAREAASGEPRSAVRPPDGPLPALAAE